jgi:hypothetical protein
MITRLVVLALVGVGCSNVQYAPTLNLPVSPETIQARVLFRELVDASPHEDREKGTWAEISCTSQESMVGTVSTGVSGAILRDLRDNEVFLEVRKRMADPDLILEGRIDRFVTKSGMTVVGIVTYPIDWITGGLFWLLGIPVRTSWGMVEMEMSLRPPDGAVLASYSASRRFRWHHTVYNTQWALFSCPTKLNEMFGEVVREIRAAMIADREILEGS